MNTIHEENMLRLLRAALHNNACELIQADFVQIFALAQSHGVSNMLQYGLACLSPDEKPTGDIATALKGVALASVSREIIQQQELQSIFSVFGEKKIPVMALKGAVVKYLYPKPELRFMSDIDLLIPPEFGEAVRESMIGLGFQCVRYGNGATDIYRSTHGMNYELHRDLSEEGFNPAAVTFLRNLMDFSAPSGEDCMLVLPHEEHYAYILCHFVKHLLDGGIGVRQVMDVYFCRRNWPMDEEKLRVLLTRLELMDFASNVERLAEHWFGNGAGDPVTEELGKYVLGSGAFGKEEQKVADRMLKQEKRSGKLSYAWSRLFPSYELMCFYYPVLKKWPILLPIFWIWRMLYACIYRRDKLKNEVAAVNKTDMEAVRRRAAFYHRCGLKVYDHI